VRNFQVQLADLVATRAQWWRPISDALIGDLI
jgi:hypothetical protein